MLQIFNRRSLITVFAAAPLSLLTGFKRKSSEVGNTNDSKVSDIRNADTSQVAFFDDSSWTAIPGDFSSIADDKNIVISIGDKNVAWFRNFSGAMNARWFGVRADGNTDDNKALQKAINATLAVRGSYLELPGGNMSINGNLIIPAPDGSATRNDQFLMRGTGAGKNGSSMNFKSGSLIIRAPNHVISDLHVTSSDSDGIQIAPTITSEKSYPSRSMLKNVRAEDCKGSGITIADCWIYTMINVFSRRNRNWGLEGKSGPVFKLACNCLNIIGGEFQGNGKKSSVDGKSEAGTGGGIFTGKTVQMSVTNAAIEGNIGDGLVLAEEVRGLTVLGCYFEKNGSHPLNVDIGNAPPSHSGLGPNSGFILNCNFTPQNVNGTPQERAIDLYDFADLRIVNPQFYSQSGPILYSKAPIRVRETIDGRSTGWVEGGILLSSHYNQNLIENLCSRFGRPTVSRFSPNIDLPANVNTETQRFLVTLSEKSGKRVSATVVARAKSGAGQVNIRTKFRRGPLGTSISNKDSTLYFPDSSKVEKTSSHTSPKDWHGHAEISIERLGKTPADTLAAAVTILAMEITTYEAHISA